MYIPKHFAIQDPATIHAFIEQYNFGQLISSVNNQPYSTHLPFLLSDDRSRLYTHLAKQNPQQHSVAGQTVLVTLQGPHGYISPSWYQSPGVPTWNYQAVHIYGHCQPLTQEQQLDTLLQQLTAKYEAALPQPWKTHYDQRLLHAIVGLEIIIERIECKYKLSQNRPAADRDNVIKQLQVNGLTELARAMQALD